MNYIGDFVGNSTVRHEWGSNSGVGASITRGTDGIIYAVKKGGLTGVITGASQANPVVIDDVAHGLENGDEVRIHSVVGMTEINNRIFTVANKNDDDFELSGEDGTGHTAYSSGGVWVQVNTADLTDTEDIEGITGLHDVTIDLSADDYFSTGSDITVRLEGAVIDDQTVNVPLFSFSIQNRFMRGTDNALEPTTAGRKLDVTTGGAAGLDWGNIENKTTVNDFTQTIIELCDTVTTNSDMRGTDGVDTAAMRGTDGVDTATMRGTDGANTTTPPTADENAAALLDLANGVETGWTVRQIMRILASALAGKSSGHSTNAPVYRSITDGKNRITATVTADGRTAVTADGT